MKSEFRGTIGAVRVVEDCIRATKKYTEGVMTEHRRHPQGDPIQGGDFPSRAFSKYYEVYPNLEIGWEMSVDDLLNWLWKDTPCIDVTFWYDYRVNRASIRIRDGAKAVAKLEEGIPGFKEALAGTVPEKWEVVS